VLHQGGGLGGALEVVVAVAGEDLGEEADAVGDGLGDPLMGGGGQDQAAAGGAFLAQPVDEFGIEGQGGHLQGCQGNEAGLEGGAALAQAGQSGQQGERPVADQGEEGFPQGVGAHQATVEVNGQGRRGDGGHGVRSLSLGRWVGDEWAAFWDDTGTGRGVIDINSDIFQ
jgi:hypothetical protein